MHVCCKKLYMWPAATGTGGLIDSGGGGVNRSTLGVEDVKSTGVENLAGGSTLQPPVNSYPVRCTTNPQQIEVMEFGRGLEHVFCRSNELRS